MPSEQPREGSYNEQADRVFSEQPRGEGDDLAALRSVIGLLREYGPANVRNVEPICDKASEALTRLARASTHPEQPPTEARVEKCRCGFPFYEDRFTIPRLDGGSVPDAWEFCPYCGGRLDEPAQPQPRGEGDAGKTRGYTREDIQANTWWPGKGGEGDDLAARLEEKARAESDEFGNYHDRYAEGPALPEPPRIESAPARVETEDIERLRDVVDRFDDGVGMNYLYVESLGRILDSLGDLTYKDLAEVDEIVIERGKTSGPEAFSWATPPKGGFDPRHDASRGPDRPASPSQSPTPTEQGETDHA